VNYLPPEIIFSENKNCPQDNSIPMEADQKFHSITSTKDIVDVAPQHMLGFCLYELWLYKGKYDVPEGISHFPNHFYTPTFPMHDVETTATETLHPIPCEVPLDSQGEIEEHQDENVLEENFPPTNKIKYLLIEDIIDDSLIENI